jgi:hypothetical protein
MQTIVWMADSDSVHFSDKFSYKILCIPSYGLKDMILASFTHVLPFSGKQKKEVKTFLTEG